MPAIGTRPEPRPRTRTTGVRPIRLQVLARGLRESLTGLSNPKLIRTYAELDDAAPGTAGAAARTLKLLARRIQHLAEEIGDLTTRITHVITQHNPQLLARGGVGPDTAATLLIAAGDNPERLRSEASIRLWIRP